MTTFGRLAVAAFALALSGTPSAAQIQLKVIVFSGLSNLMQYAALAQGYYAKRGLAVELVNTPNSTELRNGLAEGRYHIAHAAIDNAVAQVEIAKVDLFVFMGGNNGNGMPLRAAGDQFLRRPARQDAGGRRAGHRLRFACLQDAAGEGSQERRLSGQGAGRAAGADASHAERSQHGRCDPEPAANRGRTKGRAEESRPGCFGGRSLPVGFRLGAPILGTGQRRQR